MNLPEIFSKSDAIHVEKINGTVVDYFIFPEFEIHRNRIPPHCTQEWHFHSKIEEVIVVTQGELVLSWMENGNLKRRPVVQDEIIRVKRSIHTLSNETDFPCLFTVFRFVPDGVDKRELIKQDKTILKKN
ncbi:MAG TPA: cupin domain-containing protein [Firmicutes bacterium]|nr:cupin domain-containing protein [Bacillota bacterium]